MYNLHYEQTRNTFDEDEDENKVYITPDMIKSGTPVVCNHMKDNVVGKVVECKINKSDNSMNIIMEIDKETLERNGLHVSTKSIAKKNKKIKKNKKKDMKDTNDKQESYFNQELKTWKYKHNFTFMMILTPIMFLFMFNITQKLKLASDLVSPSLYVYTVVETIASMILILLMCKIYDSYGQSVVAEKLL
jgi:hypothetical protein